MFSLVQFRNVSIINIVCGKKENYLTYHGVIARNHQSIAPSINPMMRITVHKAAVFFSARLVMCCMQLNKIVITAFILICTVFSFHTISSKNKHNAHAIKTFNCSLTIYILYNLMYNHAPNYITLRSTSITFTYQPDTSHTLHSVLRVGYAVSMATNPKSDPLRN